MARLTKAPKPKLLITDKRRRHTDPPNLWLAVATGSVLFHLLLAVVILPLQGRRAGEEPQLDPVAVDLVEIDPAATNPVAIAPNAPQSNAIAQQPEPQPSSTTPPIEAFSAPPPDPQPISEPSPEPIPEPSPEPTPELSPEPIPEQPAEPQVEASPDPVPSPSTEPEQPADSTPPENLGSTEADPVPDTDPDNATTDPAPVDDSAVAEGGGNANSTPPTGDPGLPGVTVNSNANPTGWVTSAIVSQRPDRPFDVPTQIATVSPGRDRLPDPTSFGCQVEPGMETALTPQEQYAQYLAEANPYLGTPVEVHVTVEANGQVSAAQVGNTSSGSYAYDQLAVCLVQNWLEFNPALRDGEPWASDNQQVTITISSIQ
ncbi:TonB family protein [Cyanobacteria bacterium FACHB-471]|nr:TonB family protein [Cyanobacteria bacterium FACHB-471]